MRMGLRSSLHLRFNWLIVDVKFIFLAPERVRIRTALANRLIELGHHVRVLGTLLQGVDCVYHLAARVSVQESVLFPRDYNDVNVGGTVSLMEAMRAVGVKRIVLASSGTVYGDQAHQPLREDMPTNPRVPYAVTKIAAEASSTPTVRDNLCRSRTRL